MDVDVEAMTDGWVRELATSPIAGTRRQLVRVVVASIEPRRRDWLELLARDSDAVISQAAVTALGTLDGQEGEFARVAELGQRFTEGVVPREMTWEWEYLLGVWIPGSGPRGRKCLLRQRDDHEARLAVLRLAWRLGDLPPVRGGVFIRSCRLVCEYTRSPRSIDEASMWRRHGRPRPPYE